MNSSILSVQSTVVLDQVQSSIEAQQRRQVSQETFAAIALGVLTSSLMGVLYYSLYYALQQYCVL